MKALVLYTSASGRRDFSKRIGRVRAALGSVFAPLEFAKCEKPGDLSRISAQEAPHYDTLIVAGGDGTFNALINAIAPLPVRPKIGFINFGTLGDVGRNFGVTHSFARALRIIKAGKTEPFDIGRIGDSYFAYVAAAGCYSDIAYSVKRSAKKRWGKAIYYRLAAKSTLKKAGYAVRYVTAKKTVTRIVPFLMVMNGSHIGGFGVNRKSSVHDGEMELFLPKRSLSNGLAQTLFRPTSEVVPVTEVDIRPMDSLRWCLDGEPGPVGRAHFSVLPSWIQVYAK
ncbi:MAG: hypothetical protein LKG11_00610 [Bacilli bacterium]|jgi:diacylglycerol kinase family enzyme|nr:hypothetical protein [Bacilli bacterium]